VIDHLRSRAALASTPVLVVSAFAEEGDRIAAFDSSALRFLRKPFDPDDLQALAEELLAGRG